jgi:hypothetical protein
MYNLTQHHWGTDVYTTPLWFLNRDEICLKASISYSRYTAVERRRLAPECPFSECLGRSIGYSARSFIAQLFHLLW